LPATEVQPGARLVQQQQLRVGRDRGGSETEVEVPEVPPVLLDRSAAAPLAVQLADGLRRATVGGSLRPGDRLPSTRELATVLGVSRTVTAAAYDQLLAEGWVQGRRGVGTFVVGTPGVGPAAAPPVLPAAVTPAPAGGAGHVDLRAGSPCLEVLDRAAWRRAWRAAGDLAPDGRPDGHGDPGFRAAVAEHLLRHRGLVAGPDDVLATSGTSAAVAEIAALLPAGARVAVEEPGYQRAVGALRDRGVTVVPVPVDDDGLVVDALPDRLAAVYCTPAHQYPLGRRLSAPRRSALVARARTEGWWVLEDDYDGELRYDVAPLPLLAALGPDVVVHLGTASKVLSSTLGVGWMVAPGPLRDGLVERRARTGTRPPRAGQRVLAALATSGDLSRHLRRLRRELVARRALVLAAVEAGGAVAHGDLAGAHVVVPLPDAATEAAVLAAAEQRGVLLDGLARHHASPAGPRRSGMVLGWAAPSRTELVGALAILTDVLTATVPKEPGSARRQDRAR
ncbi:PLP-dependent aminotransferase family protein, partial [Goekera deserti]|uniref:MocR-like pyridoxine biosynthesis transcription factor PdxR n=1 Tax=Goekera deserti TaxID=2497753 RepID=UPI001F39D1CB